jgi:glutathione S-transferase
VSNEQLVADLGTPYGDVSVDGQERIIRYICGKDVSAADIALTVIANWGSYYPQQPTIGPNVKRMLREIIARPSYTKALKLEQVEYKAAA